jgi:hypothetical protein
VRRRAFLELVAAAPLVAALKPWRPARALHLHSPAATWTLTFPADTPVPLSGVAIIRHNIAPMHFTLDDGTKLGPFDHYLKSAAWP